MAALFFLNGQNPAILPGVKLVKATDANLYLEALELREKIVAKGEELAKRAEEERKTRSDEGYQDGLAAGRDEYTLKIMDTVMASVEYLEKFEVDLANIVDEAVRKIIGDLPSDEVVVGLVKKALKTMRDDRKILVRVSPEDESAVRTALVGTSEGWASFLDVRGDGRLSRGDCVLESDLGVVEASVETQLRNLSEALKNSIRSKDSVNAV
ncbi:MAG: HrpE/YscL family type III secretion apparatus protein [Deltaproteobacteria bacterium]|jgi:type III secretion protein L|nr:HrpE/YscL family type III secretion apparatus protein [Deltaproteobacteria bacterium]